MYLRTPPRSSTALIIFILIVKLGVYVFIIMDYNFPKEPTQRVLPKPLPPVRVLCWVMTHPGNHEKRAVHVKNTWGKKCDKLLFMSSVDDPELPSIKLNVSEGRGFLWGKVKAAFKYVYENHFDEADWFLKADDDSFVVVENLKLMLSKYDPNSAIHFGGMLRRLIDKQIYFSGGAGYILSKEALRRFVKEALPYSNRCRTDDETFAGDLEIGICLQNVGVKAVDTRDNKRYRFLPLALEHNVVPWALGNSWYWEYIAFSQKMGFECCSETAVGFHYVKPVQMYIFHYLLYEFRSPYEFVFEESKRSRVSNSDTFSIKYRIGPSREVLALSQKVLCWDFGSSEEQKVSLNNTWGQRCDKLVFMSKFSDYKLPTIRLISKSKDYLMAALEYLYKNHFSKTDWFVKVKVSTYLVVENLKLELRKYDPSSPIYLKTGSGNVLSKGALRKFVMEKSTKDCVKHGKKANEFGKCLKSVGVEIKDWSSRFLHIDLNRTSPMALKDPETTIGFQNLSPNQLHEFDYLIYRLRPFPFSSKKTHWRFLVYPLILLLIICICRRVWLIKISF